MKTINSLIKWPGGKTGEIKMIEHLIPQYDRYIEPFFGGGALYFHLMPQNALINDISADLMQYYRLLKEQNYLFKFYLTCYDRSFKNLLNLCEKNFNRILKLYNLSAGSDIDRTYLYKRIRTMWEKFSFFDNDSYAQKLILNKTEFDECIVKMVYDKYLRTVKNNSLRTFSKGDLKANIITGFAAGYYVYFRNVLNYINSGKIGDACAEYSAANFYFIREYCYGSMFRYNCTGDFNIPYGGMSYNSKNFSQKIDNMFNRQIKDLFCGAKLHCQDFETFLKSIDLNENDFIFLDPPYDSDFSEYEGKAFTHVDQERLAKLLKTTKAKFMMVIKNTEFISSLYSEDVFNVGMFDNFYNYNVRSRNDRKVEHLIITNYAFPT